MIVTVANHKGGVGKTTTVLTLAHLMQLKKQPVSVLDLDAPSSERRAGAAAAQRKAQALEIPAYTFDELPDMVQGDILIDAPPDAADTALERALAMSDLVVIPSSLSPDDLEVTMVFYESLPEANRAVLFTLVPYYHEGKVQTMQKQLKGEKVNCFKTFIPRSEAVQKAAEDGQTVATWGSFSSAKAKAAYENLLKEIVKHGK
jgi:cellulose biosynthesis protein BcsQ